MTAFNNSFPDYSAASNIFLNESEDDLSPKFKEKLQTFKEKKLQILLTDLKRELFCHGTIYTGSGGLAFYYLMSSLNEQSVCEKTMQQITDYIDINNFKGYRISFLCGDAGPLAIMIVISYKLNIEKETLVERLLNLKTLLNKSPDELLYGKVGYLYSLLFVNKHVDGKTLIPDHHIKEVINTILASGKELSQNKKSKSPLLWQWHEKIYLGAAHGMAGILYMLLQAHAYIDLDDIEVLIKPTIDWLIDQRFPSGNFCSALGSTSGDRLVQWCHGAPGFVPMCISAHEVFKDEKYLNVAIKCCDVIWERGLCAKGFSICHGVSGNTYAFLQMYQATKKPVYLHRACTFAEWCVDERVGAEKHHPDRPASLFEGLLGRIYLADDMMHPLTARFPAFCI